MAYLTQEEKDFLDDLMKQHEDEDYEDEEDEEE